MVGAALLALAAGILSASSRGVSPGPLAAPAGTSSVITVPANVGDRLSLGVDTPNYLGSDPAVLEALVPDHVPGGLRILGFRAIMWGEGGMGAERAFPPRSSPLRGLAHYRLRPVRGFVVKSGRGAALVVGLEPVRTGVFTVPGFTLVYRIGARWYAARYEQALKVCAPSSKRVDVAHMKTC